LLKAKSKEVFSAVIEIKAGKARGVEGTHAEGTGPLIRQSRDLSPLTKLVDDGMKQIEDKMYVQDLISEGYTKILKVSLAVDGKDIVARVK